MPKDSITKILTTNESENNRYYDGNGREAKRTGKDYVEDGQGGGSWIDAPTKYYIRSSVLGNEVVSEADATGRKAKTIVRAAGATVAWQTSYFNTSNQTETEYVNFEHFDASGLSYRSTLSDGTAIYNEGGEGSPAELDPLGSNVGLYTPYIELTAPPFEPEYPTLQPMNEDMPMYVNGQRVTATLDGMEIPYGLAMSMMQNGSAVQCPNNYCGPQVYTFNGRNVLSSPFRAYADGTSGYWIDENDPNSPAPPDPDTIDAGGVRARFVQVSTSTVSWNLIDSRGGQPIIPHPDRGRGEERPKFDCDTFLSNLFGDPGAYFFDNTFWKKDSIMGYRPGNEHSHLYGSENDSSVSTNVYFPEGGVIVSPGTRVPGSQYLGSSRQSYEFEGKTYVEHNANYVLVQFAKLGKLQNVTLAIYHIDNFKLEKQEDGRTLIGTIGFTGAENYGSGGAIVRKDSTRGGHSHLELLQGRKWNLNNKKLLNFRDICP